MNEEIDNWMNEEIDKFPNEGPTPQQTCDGSRGFAGIQFSGS